MTRFAIELAVDADDAEFLFDAVQSQRHYMVLAVGDGLNQTLFTLRADHVSVCDLRAIGDVPRWNSYGKSHMVQLSGVQVIPVAASTPQLDLDVPPIDTVM